MSKTIVAASTPVGGAIAIVRLSGEKSKKTVEKLCGRKIDKFREAYFVTIDTGVVKDKCEVIIYDKGKSYTGEQSAEIFCHGSEVIVKEIIEFCINNGAFLAERGEFTLRAYKNKKIDLSEAEGILDLINSETIEQAVNAYDSASGRLKQEITSLQAQLKEIIAKIDVAIDYPEENIEQTTKEEACKLLVPLSHKTHELASSYKDGYRIKNGIRVIICGKPNVGKSELFNALIGKKRAIVSEQEGTTRDFIENEYIYKGRKFVLIDTAGMRRTDNLIEEQGIEMMFEEAKSANLVLGVGVQGDEFNENALKDNVDKQKIFAITNKCDIRKGKNFNVSAKENIGIESLKEEIYKRTSFDTHGLKINNIRQYMALKEADEFLDSALGCEMTLDCFASDLSCAYDKLGSITGAIGSDEIIAEIFSHFCVGK